MKYCVFVEKVYDDEKFNLLKEFLKKKGRQPVNLESIGIGGGPHYMYANPVKLFVTTPANYYLAVAEQGYKGTMKQFEKILLERYKELEQMGCEINLHLHLAMNLESIDQELMFRKAVEWMRHNGFNPKLITFGWYIFNAESLRLAKKYGLEFHSDAWEFSYHDYELPHIFTPMMIAQNLRGMLR